MSLDCVDTGNSTQVFGKSNTITLFQNSCNSSKYNRFIIDFNPACLKIGGNEK